MKFISKASVKARAAGVLCVVSGVALVTNAWIDHLSGPLIFDEVARVPSRYCAIVLGARVYKDGTPSAVLADRLNAALELYRARKVTKILVSGDHMAPEYDEVNAMRSWLLFRGVDSKDVFMDHAGFRTLDTMERARKVFGVTEAVICTQRFHLPRSVFLAKRAGIDAVGVVADQREYLSMKINKCREFVAKSVSFFDSYVFHTKPSHPYDGENAISIKGNAMQTHDYWTR